MYPKEEKARKVKEIQSSLNKENYEYYLLIIKKPKTFVGLNDNVSSVFDTLFSSAGLKNEISTILYDYCISISKDGSGEFLMVLVDIVDSLKVYPSLIDYGIFFYKDEDERKDFLNFIHNYHIIFKPHEINALQFDGVTKYTDKQFIEAQKTWILSLNKNK